MKSDERNVYWLRMKIKWCFHVVGDTAALHRGTPLYGQPSWWGDGDADDENSFKQENKAAGKKQETHGTGEASSFYTANGIAVVYPAEENEAVVQLHCIQVAEWLILHRHYNTRWHSGTANRNATLQLWVPWFDPGDSVRSYVCVYVGFPRGLQLSVTLQKQELGFPGCV